MENAGVAGRSLRLLKDSEIVKAIERDLIKIDKPEVYLRERRNDLIQSASMDLVLRGVEDHYPILGVHPPFENHSLYDSVAEGCVTFWPGWETEASVAFLQGYDGKILYARPELRSTLRRVGLDIGFSPLGIGFGDDNFGFLSIRNPQEYPVSVARGLKISQILWMDRGTKEAAGGYGIEEREDKLGSGRLISSRSDLLALMGQGDLYLSNPDSVGDKGEILFHAGRVRTYSRQGPVIISEKGVSGFEIMAENAINHRINPGHFSDIETQERIGLSGRVGVHVFYAVMPFPELGDRADLINYMNTTQSSGGWIDPGYGHAKSNGAVFSVQRKAFTRPITINEGDLVAYGQVYHFPEAVEQAYSAARGSHYNDAEGFMGPRK